MEGVRPAVIYDASRLCTRVLNPTPNGIDRLDALLARAFLCEGSGASLTLIFGFRGPRLLPASEGFAALERAERMWSEGARAESEGILARIERWLENPSSAHEKARSWRLIEKRRGRILSALQALARVGLWRGVDPVRCAPPDAVYLNVTHFPLDWPSHTAWLETRRDIRLVEFVHDLLPIEKPEFFWKGEGRRHQARISLLAHRGNGAIVTTLDVEHRLRDEMVRAGRQDLQIMRAHPPVAPLFHTRTPLNVRLCTSPYFIVCGTIEPRKNHVLLLRVWHLLIAQKGLRAPKLIVIGKRGWLCDDVIKQMQHPVLAEHVLEVSGLPSGTYKKLLDHACALLAPSFAEGFGLPMAEALRSGVPVIASDIPAFREQATQLTTLIDPHAVDSWLDAVAHRLSLPSALTTRSEMQSTGIPEADYLREIDAFLRTLD